MNQPQSSPNHRRTLVAVAIAAAAAGFVIGVGVGKNWPDEPDSEIPCPSCRIDRLQNRDVCELVGQIDPDWPAMRSPLVLMSPLAMGTSEVLHPGDCFRIPVPCPVAAAAAEPLRFKEPSSLLLFGNDWCSSGCVEKMTCAP